MPTTALVTGLQEWIPVSSTPRLWAARVCVEMTRISRCTLLAPVSPTPNCRDQPRQLHHLLHGRRELLFMPRLPFVGVNLADWRSCVDAWLDKGLAAYITDLRSSFRLATHNPSIPFEGLHDGAF